MAESVVKFDRMPLDPGGPGERLDKAEARIRELEDTTVSLIRAVTDLGVELEVRDSELHKKIAQRTWAQWLFELGGCAFLLWVGVLLFLGGCLVLIELKHRGIL